MDLVQRLQAIIGSKAKKTGLARAASSYNAFAIATFSGLIIHLYSHNSK